MWAVVLEAANGQEQRGQHGNLDFEAIDCQLGLQDGAARDIYTALCDRGLVDGEEGLVKQWDKRQPRREREADGLSTERVKRFRAKAAQVNDHATHTDGKSVDSSKPNAVALHGVTSHETPCNAMKRQKQPRGEERREEESNTSFSDQRVGAPPAVASPSAPPPAVFGKSPNSEPSKQGTRLPADWSMPDEWRAFCVSQRPDLDSRAVAERFADHWHAVPGAKGRKTDWLATWRNWVRNERQAAGQARSPDIARSTTPGPVGRDPVLVKIDAEAKLAAPIPAYIREQNAKLKTVGA